MEVARDVAAIASMKVRKILSQNIGNCDIAGDATRRSRLVL